MTVEIIIAIGIACFAVAAGIWAGYKHIMNSRSGGPEENSPLFLPYFGGSVWIV